MALNGLDERDFVDDIMLTAQNDGNSYRNGKDAEGAIAKAFRAFQERRREEEAEVFEMYRKTMAKSVKAYWRNR